MAGVTTYFEFGLSCPACFQDLSLSLVEDGDHLRRGPVEGDQTVCGHCTSFLRYKEELGPNGVKLGLVVIERDEFEMLPEQHQIELMAARNKLIAVRAQGREQEEAILGAMARELGRLKGLVMTLSCRCLYCSSGDGFNCVRRRAHGPL